MIFPTIVPLSKNWLVVSTPLKNMKVSLDDYSQYMESHKIDVPNHQPVMIGITTPSVSTVSTSLSPGCFELPFLSQPRMGFLGLSHPIGPPVPIVDTLW